MKLSYLCRFTHSGTWKTHCLGVIPIIHQMQIISTEGVLRIALSRDFQLNLILPTYTLRCDIFLRWHFFNWSLFVFHKMLAIFHRELSLVCFSSTDQNGKSNKLCRNSKSRVISQYAKFLNWTI